MRVLCFKSFVAWDHSSSVTVSMVQRKAGLPTMRTFSHYWVYNFISLKQVVFISTIFNIQYLCILWGFRFSRLREWRWQVFWDTALCSLVEVDRSFRGAHWLHRPEDGGSTRLWNVGALFLRRLSSSTMHFAHWVYLWVSYDSRKISIKYNFLKHH
jgi:hypothetical protein